MWNRPKWTTWKPDKISTKCHQHDGHTAYIRLGNVCLYPSISHTIITKTTIIVRQLPPSLTRCIIRHTPWNRNKAGQKESEKGLAPVTRSQRSKYYSFPDICKNIHKIKNLLPLVYTEQWTLQLNRTLSGCTAHPWIEHFYALKCIINSMWHWW